jgi:hypothetical protein
MSVEVPESIRESAEVLVSITKDLAGVVSEICEQITILKEERAETTGEVRDAYNLVIKNKVWILQKLIGAYWLKTLNLELDKVDELPSPPTSTRFIDCDGPTGTVVIEDYVKGCNGTTGESGEGR